MDKINIAFIFFCIGLLILVIGMGIKEYDKINSQEIYDKGYAQGFYKSRFIDCSLPSMNETMEIIFYDEKVNGNIKHHYLNWRELCDRLKLTGFYKKIDSEEAYGLVLEIYKIDNNISEFPEVIEEVLKEAFSGIESEENYLALFDDSRTKYLEATKSGGKK